MGQTMFLECNAGISGDMTVAALLDLGADWEGLKAVMDSLKVEGFSIEKERVLKSGVDCMGFTVKLDAAHGNHDHDMEYLHGNAGSDHHHDHHHDHDHEHDHDHDHHHDHEHRSLHEINTIIDGSSLTEHAKELAKKIFRILAEAEAKAHATTPEEVHFHEVGAVDSIADIVACAYCLDNLNIDRVYVSTLVEGCGTVRTQHGILPIPVPAVSNILEAYQIPVQLTDTMGEFVTPTGAAIVAAITTDYGRPKNMVINSLGMGAGKRNYERPSILRAMLIEEQRAYFEEHREADEIIKLETNIDDCTGEALGFLMEMLMTNGAIDVHYLPCFMKKNRPAFELHVLCDEKTAGLMESLIFRHTTTIGIRRQQMSRTILARKKVDFESDYGTITAKQVTVDGKVRYYPEYESIAEVCRRTGAAFEEVYNSVYNLSER